jgi:hypothetical protein
MAYTIESSTICSVKAVTENGDSLVMEVRFVTCIYNTK